MSVQTDPLPPAPEHTPPLKEDEIQRGHGRFFNQVWTRWFISLRDKVNAISATLVNLGDMSVTGIVVKDGDQWFARTIKGTPGNVTVVDGSGLAGDPTIDLETTGVTPGSYPNATVSVDAFGRITAAEPGNGQVGITFQDEGTPLGATGTVNTVDFVGAGVTASRSGDVVTVNVSAGSGGVASVSSGTGINVDNTDPLNPVVNLSSGSSASLALADTAIQASDLGSAAFSPSSAFEPSFLKGNLVAGTNVTLGGSLTGRLVGGGNVTINATGGGGGGSAVRTTAGTVEGLSAVTMAKTQLLLDISCNVAARIRLYCTAAARSSDAARVRGIDPAPGSGLLLEFITTPSFLAAALTPGIIAYNLDPVVTNIIYFNVEPDFSPTAVVTVGYLPSET